MDQVGTMLSQIKVSELDGCNVTLVVQSVTIRAVRRQKKGAKKGALYRRLRRLLRRLYIVNAVLEASGRQALLLGSF